MNAAAQAFRSDRMFLTPGGTETYLMFQQGYPLREMCAFDVIDDEEAWQRLARDYFRPIFAAARDSGHTLLPSFCCRIPRYSGWRSALNGILLACAIFTARI